MIRILNIKTISLITLNFKLLFFKIAYTCQNRSRMTMFSLISQYPLIIIKDSITLVFLLVLANPEYSLQTFLGSNAFFNTVVSNLHGLYASRQRPTCTVTRYCLSAVKSYTVYLKRE